VRLLAHGGKSYSERHRIGAWSAIPREVLESSYGLPGDSMTYGVGILDDCLPFLIVRVSQLTDIGRDYAYSLLLDPGREVWERFGWNAADLLRTILADEIGKTVLSDPETLTIEDLVHRFSLLKPMAPNLARPKASDQTLDQIACWIGAAFSDEPVVLPPNSLGFANRPSLDGVAELLSRIPQPGMRAGRGWLIGGSREHGESLGARLVLDEGMQEVASPVECIQRGYQALEALRRIAANSEFGSALAKLEGLLFCEWNQGASASALLERLQLLAQLIASEQPADSLLQNLEQQLSRLPFLAGEIRRAAHALILNSKSPHFSPTQTTLLLRNYFEEGFEVGQENVERLDPQTLIQMLLTNGPQSRLTTAPLPLSAEIRADVLVRGLGSAASYAELPRLLTAASASIEKTFGRGTRAESWQAKLLDQVEMRTKTTDSSLHVWDSFPPDHQASSGLAEILKHEARDRAKRRSEGWELEYLCYGKDVGGKELLRANISNADASQLVVRYLQEITQESDLATAAKEWIHQLALSDLRVRINVADKVAIANNHFSDQWLPFLALWSAYTDGPEIGPFPSGVANLMRQPTYLRLLQVELYQMLREFPPRAKFPDLRRLQKLLGTVPQEFIEELRKSSQRLSSTQEFARWIDGLQFLGYPELAARETARFCLQSHEPLPPAWLFKGFDEETLSDLIDKVMFQGVSVDDKFLRARCQEILNTRYHAARLRKTVDRVCKNEWNDRVVIENFLRRFGGHEEILDLIFNCFTPGFRQLVVGGFLVNNSDSFVKNVRTILDDVDRGATLNLYRYTVLKFVRNADPDLRKKIVRWTILTKSGLEQRLDEILVRAYDERQELAGETVEASKQPLPPVGESSASDNQQESASHASQETDSTHRKTQGRLGAVRELFRSVIYEEPLTSLTPEQPKTAVPPTEEDNP
jgi:hypothetical protein